VASPAPVQETPSPVPSAAVERAGAPQPSKVYLNRRCAAV
jgi:hypothetical protein